jgi:SHS2 domain-containing protein
MKKWELFNHMADIGIRGFGKSVSEAFEMGALALTSVITFPGRVRKIDEISINCRAKNLDFLFYDWINSLIYEMEVRKMLFRSFSICINGFDELTLDALVSGEHIDKKRHEPAVIVKGATMTELHVTKRGRLWTAQCIVDV